MTSNTPPRERPWRIGSFTKNFSWGNPANGLKRLHKAINVGFANELKPIPRDVFWNRLEAAGFIPHIPSNFFLFNGIIDDINFIFPDELVFKALTSPHDRSFDKLAFFTLLLSEAGHWKGARSGQSQPSEWARYFLLEELPSTQTWEPAWYNADRIQDFLQNSPHFEGGAGTRKLATNLAYFFSLAGIEKFKNEDNLSWISDCLFLALDRYYMIEKPINIGIEWGIDTLSKHDVASLSGPYEQSFVEYQSINARLYIESNGLERLSDRSLKTVFGILSRDPLIYKILPSIVGEWLKTRLFVEFVSKAKLDEFKTFDTKEFYEKAFYKLSNSIPKPTISGDQLLALVRPQDDSD